MKGTNYTRKITAAAFLLLFLFGTTPKIFLHYLIADHNDSFFYNSYKGRLPVTQVTKTTINCHYESTVIESPFVAFHLQLVTPVPLVYTLLLFTYFDDYSLPHRSYFKLRGPPSLSIMVV